MIQGAEIECYDIQASIRSDRRKIRKIITRKVMESMPEGAKTMDGKAELIQMLIPLGLKAVNDLLQEEVALLVAATHSSLRAGVERKERCGRRSPSF